MNTEALLTERGKTHGAYSLQARCTQEIKSIIRSTRSNTKYDFTPEQQDAIDMICMKLGRIAAGDPSFRDHWADICGYSELARKSIKVDGNAAGEREVQEATTTKEKVAIKAAQEACQTSGWPGKAVGFPTYSYQLEG